MKAKDEQALSRERRRSMIAEAAYFRAEHRAFQGGDPVADWLEAEAEINARLASAGTGNESASAKRTLDGLSDEAEKARAEMPDSIDTAVARFATKGSASGRRRSGKAPKQ